MKIEEELRAMTRDDHGIKFTLKKDPMSGEWSTHRVDVFISEWAIALGLLAVIVPFLGKMGVKMPDVDWPGWDFPVLSGLMGVGETIGDTLGTVEREATGYEDPVLEALLKDEQDKWLAEGMPGGVLGLAKRHKAIIKEFKEG